MAESCRLDRSNIDNKHSNIPEENLGVIGVLFVFVSFISILADLTTDILVFIEYCKNGYLYWALSTLIFMLCPNILNNTFSIRWLAGDQKISKRFLTTHLLMVGYVERYIIFLHQVFTCKNFESIQTSKLISQKNDLNMLHFLYIFTGTVPQIILQSYAIITLDENYQTKAFALTASIASVVWGCSTYINSILIQSNGTFHWNSLLINLVWHFGMLAARVSAILLFTILFEVWILLPIGLHWTAMTFWIILQKTTFCPNKFEETLYNVVMGFVYCFSYINLREGHTRYRLLIFYLAMITQNFATLILHVLISPVIVQKKTWSMISTINIIVGTVIGVCAMILYYRYFHSKGPITWGNSQDIELNNKVAQGSKNDCKENNKLNHVRSFKSSQKNDVTENNSKNVSASNTTQIDADNADKKFLLDHWIARSGSPTFTSAPVGINSTDVSSIDFHTVQNTPQALLDNTGAKSKKTICSPTELALKLSSIEHIESSIDEITFLSLNTQKRRGICSSDQLRHNIKVNLDILSEKLTKNIKFDHCSQASRDSDSSNKKTSSDSIDMDLDLSFSDINSSDINTFNENIVQKLCLSALKNIKDGNQDADIENIQKIALDILKEMYTKKGKTKSKVNIDTVSSKSRDLDTPTELLSVHDYENICAVNIAREAWGLRSWNGYIDIENWLHDGSVVRDRRRDTLTSGSSEISSCLSHELKSAIATAAPFPKKSHTYSNILVKFDKNNQYYTDPVYASTDDPQLNKSHIVDATKDLNQLEPILEELDDLGDIDHCYKKRLNSESSLVATIDEIRKATITNSPRNVHHRREIWDSPQINDTSKMESTLKRALWKEPSKYDSNIMEHLPEKENILNVSHESKCDRKKMELSNLSTLAIAELDLDTSDNMTYTRMDRRRPKSHDYNKPKNTDRPPSQHLQDLSNKDIDFLWQLVSEHNLPVNSTDDLVSSRMISSMQSLIQGDEIVSKRNTAQTKTSNVKKSTRSKPRRKFSILRDKFEPKLNINSDEEVLYSHYDSTQNLNPATNKNTEVLGIDNPIVIAQTGLEKFSGTDPITGSSLTKNIKERRSLFMKQVLSPPKFNTKLRHKM